MNRQRFLITATVLYLIFCLPFHASARTEITVSAAISLKNAFEEIGASFKAQYPAIGIVFNFGGSGALARQIEAGAPVDERWMSLK